MTQSLSKTAVSELSEKTDVHLILVLSKSLCDTSYRVSNLVGRTIFKRTRLDNLMNKMVILVGIYMASNNILLILHYKIVILENGINHILCHSFTHHITNLDSRLSLGVCNSLFHWFSYLWDSLRWTVHDLRCLFQLSSGLTRGAGLAADNLQHHRLEHFCTNLTIR